MLVHYPQQRVSTSQSSFPNDLVTANTLHIQTPSPSTSLSLSATNATRAAVRVDVAIGAAGQAIESDDPAIAAVDGVATWSVTVAPGATADVRYRHDP